MSKPEKMRFNEKVTVACAYCEGSVRVGYGLVEVAGEERPVLLHSMPPCKRFIEDDALDFLTACRVAQEKRTAN
jgi:hypothetical protein